MREAEKIEGGFNKVVMKELFPLKSTGFSEMPAVFRSLWSA